MEDFRLPTVLIVEDDLPLRAAAVKGVGEGRYRGLFALTSAAVLAWMIWSFAFTVLRTMRNQPITAQMEKMIHCTA